MCKAFRLLSLSVLFVGLQIAAAGDTTVVFQNDLYGYTGCEDSYVYTTYGLGTENFGELEELKVHRESC